MNRLKSVWQKARSGSVTFPVRLRYMGGIVIAAILILAGFVMFSDKDGYFLNLYTELAGVIVTILFVNTFLYSQSEKRRERDLIEKMLREARSPETVVSGNALHEIEEYISRSADYSFYDGKNFGNANWENVRLFRSMRKAVLDRTKIKDSDLGHTDLSGASLGWVELDNVQMTQAVLGHSYMHRIRMKNVNLYHSDLSHVYMTSAELEEVSLCNANLKNANLHWAEFRCVDLTNADLSHANLSGASLLWSDLSGATFSEQTIMPDDSNWKPSTDILKFSNPNHPDLWLSDDRMSPAYRGYHERRLNRFSKD